MGQHLLLAAMLTFSVPHLFGQQISSAEGTVKNALVTVESGELEFSSAPNPFSRQTTITIQLPQSGKVSLKVFDVLGQEVSSVMNEFLVKGTHSIKYAGSELPAGRYYFHLNVGGKVLIRPVLKR